MNKYAGQRLVGMDVKRLETAVRFGLLEERKKREYKGRVHKGGIKGAVKLCAIC